MPQRLDKFTINRNHPLAKGAFLLGLGAHAGSTRYHDSSVYGNSGTGTAIDSTNWKYSPSLGRAMLTLDGAAESVTVPANPAIIGPAITWSAWIRLNGANDTDVIVETSTNYNSNTGSLLCYLDSTKIYLSHRTAGNYNLGNITRPSTGTLFHLCVVHDVTLAGAGEIKAYVNGSEVTVTKTNNSEGSNFASYAMYLGARAATSLFTYMDLADVVMHRRAIATPEVQQLADPSNVMLSGLIQPPRRKWWPVASGGTPAAFKTFWANRATQVAA